MGDGKLWIGCNKCDKWNHASCEIAYGQDEDMKRVAEEEEKAEEKRKQNPDAEEEIESDSNDDYFCLKCRKNRKTANKSKASNSKPLVEKKKASL